MKQAAVGIALIASCVAGMTAADLHKTLLGQWVVDERARLEASPLYKLSTPEKKKEIEKQAMSMPPTKIEFKDASYNFMPGPPIAYKIIKRGTNSLVLETTEEFDGKQIKDELTVEYISDASLRVTMKSQGFPLMIKRSK